MAKIRINYYLKDKEAKEETPINLFASYDGQRLKWYTREHVKPKDWSFKRKRPKKLPELSRYLDTMETDVKELYMKFRNDEKRIPSIEEFKAMLNERFKDVKPEQEVSLLSFLDDYIERNPKSLATNTLKQYRTLEGHLRGFVEATAFKLTFKNINGSFDELFSQYLATKEDPLSPSSINKMYGILKTFLRYATKMGYNPDTIYTTFQHKRKSTLKVALTQSELDALKALKLSGNQELYRDVFLFCCVTAMEFSAVAKLKPSDIKRKYFPEFEEVDYVEYYRTKNATHIQAPLLPEAMTFLAKYKDEERATCFPKLHNQLFNRYIKDIAAKAGINEPIEKIRYEGTNEVKEVLPKHELISSHTGRRTFVTLWEGDDRTCMYFTGHSSLSQLEEYRKETLGMKLRRAYKSLKND